MPSSLVRVGQAARSSRRFAVALIVCVAALAACADEAYREDHSRCQRYARATVECYDTELADNPFGTEYEFRRRVAYLALNCQSKLGKGPQREAMNAMLGCAAPAGEAPDCVAFDACTTAAKAEANEARLKRAVDDGDEVTVLALCAVDKDLVGCVDAKEGLVQGIIDGQLIAIRDGTLTQAPSTVCFRAKALARSAVQGAPSERAVALMNKVERACRQAAAGRRLREVLVELDRLRQAKRMRIPHRCKALLMELDRMDQTASTEGRDSVPSKSPKPPNVQGGTWESQARALVARSCYVDWGADVLDKLLASARKCNPALRDIVKTAREYGLDKVLGARYRSALELCPVKSVR